VAAGLVLGMMVAVLVGRLLQTLLVDVRPSDPIALGVGAIVFAAIAVSVCLLPAFRASRVDLMESLRQE
jgi:putative ABC transport system permease protein